MTEDRDSDPPVYKQCPDCAEHVLAAARKCRYCGYRFDGRRRARGDSLLDGLLGAPHRSHTGETTFEEILADWGTHLGPDEVVEWFRLADVDHQIGYLLATNIRLVFFRQASRTRHERAFEYPLTLIGDVRLSGRGSKRRLALRAGTLGHAVQGVGGADLERLSRYLVQVAAPREPPDGSRSRADR